MSAPLRIRLFLPGAIALAMLPGAPRREASAMQVETGAIEVLDGDTLRIAGVPVRLRGLDAPELRARCEREKALAERARQRLEQLVVPGVRLDRIGRDRYGRTLAEVRDDAGRDVAQVMIGEGLAVAYAGHGRRPGWCG